MTKRHTKHDPTDILLSEPGVGAYFGAGQSVPTDGQAGYSPGCYFVQNDGSGNTSVYINVGSATSCNFDTLAEYPIADAGNIITATTIEAALQENRAAIDVIEAARLAMLPTGIACGSGFKHTNTVCDIKVTRIGDLAKTEIYIDITDTLDGDTNGDIIGKDGQANAYITQITDAVNGSIVGGKVECLETPATGNTDIDFWGGITEGTLAQDAAITTATGETQWFDHGAWAAEEVDYIANDKLPSANGYVYLANGTSTDAVYTAGKFLVTLWGTF